MAKKLIKVGFRESRNGIPSGVYFGFKEGGAHSGFGGYCSKEIADLILEHFPDELISREQVPPEERDKTECKCGKNGHERLNRGLACGVHCDECFEQLVSDCRKRSW